MKSYIAKRPYESTRLTRQAIRKTFLALAAQLPFNKISVREICKRMAITRTAFYYHYDDLYAVLDDVLDELIAGIGVEDVFSMWLDDQHIPIDIPCKIVMERVGHYIAVNDCDCLLTNTMLAGYMADYIIQKSWNIVLSGRDDAPEASKGEAEKAFRFCFAGIFFVYASNGWSHRSTEEYPKEMIRELMRR